jgi:hypothetical protein
MARSDCLLSWVQVRIEWVRVGGRRPLTLGLNPTLSIPCADGVLPPRIAGKENLAGVIRSGRCL